ncbi:DUF2267 domain-containing protein [Streptomyces sp. NPDC101209]|uniref:DUF2267 domain-containing protein n=1 Tax=Streptomyces sp. NPDC101209 TaxID=3366129 RepID=UPI0037F4CC83
MTFEEVLETVRHEGAYASRLQAEEVVRTVLAAFGRQLPEEVRTELTILLPHEASEALASGPPSDQHLTAYAFVVDLASRTNGTSATARWNAGTVLRVVSHMAGEQLTRRIIGQLPSGYALLFGRAELITA